MSSLSKCGCIVVALATLLAWTTPGSARVPGTRPTDSPSLRAKAPRAAAVNGLRPLVTETGRIGVSLDGTGTLAESSLVEVEKPPGAAVRRAFLAAASTGFSGHRITAGEITIDGAAVSWDTEVETAFNSYNYFTEVTSLVAGKFDAAPAGRIPFTVRERSPEDVDGVALIVIFDDAGRSNDATVVLFFGAQNTAGDHFSLGFASPLNAGTPSLEFDLSLGISFGFQSTAVHDQFSVVDVNGSRLTSSAGGQDDGSETAGALFTVGGVGDFPGNPDPTSPPIDARSDDERYDLVPYLKDGDARLLVETANPSDDDNLFLACVTTSVALETASALILTPSRSIGDVGTTHTVTASYEDSGGDPIAGADVSFEIVAGPHRGATFVTVTDPGGDAAFSYLGTAAGVDSIRATAPGVSGDVVSNLAVRTWTEAGTDDYKLTLTPQSSTGAVGSRHVVTAELQNAGVAEPGRRVVFEVFAGPNAGDRDSSDTNGSGIATFAYAGTVPGIDSLLAHVTIGGTIVASNRVARTWTTDGSSDTVDLRLAPVSATGEVGTSHTVMARLLVNAMPEPGRRIDFLIFSGPHAGTSGADTTDAAGVAIFTYSGMHAGVDSIVARTTFGGVDVTSNTATMRWTSGGTPTYDITLTPTNAIRDIGMEHTVTATVRANGVGLPDVRVEFAVLAGPHVGTGGADTTSAGGTASFAYTGTRVGSDTLRAVALLDGQGFPSNTVTVAWAEAPNPGVSLRLDVKPTSCVNPINTGSMGVTPVSLLGSADFDVRDVDVSTLRLEGVPPLRHQYGDVSRPGPNVDCGCSTEGPDGYRDLNLKFDTQDFVAALGPVTDRETRVVHLLGRFKDGRWLIAGDCIRIIDNDGGSGGDAEGDGSGDGSGDGDPIEDRRGPRFVLNPVTPNPFNPAAAISYEVPADGHVRLVVYDVRGRIVASLVNARQTAGPHMVTWDPGSLPSGVYFARLESAGRSTVRRAVLAK